MMEKIHTDRITGKIELVVIGGDIDRAKGITGDAFFRREEGGVHQDTGSHDAEDLLDLEPLCCCVADDERHKVEGCITHSIEHGGADDALDLTAGFHDLQNAADFTQFFHVYRITVDRNDAKPGDAVKCVLYIFASAHSLQNFCAELGVFGF